MPLSIDWNIHSPQDLLNQLRSIISYNDEFKSLPRKQRAIYAAIRGELIECLQEESDNLMEQCQIYLRIIEHCCDLEDWQIAKNLILSNASGKQTVSEQLSILGCYGDKCKIYTNLLGKLDLDFDCFLWGEIGASYEKMGDQKNAFQCREKQLDFAQSINNYDQQVSAYNGFARIFIIHNLDNLKQGYDYAQKSLQIIEKFSVKDYKNHIDSLLNFAAACCNLRNYKDAIRYIEKALQIAKYHQDLYITTECLTELGGTYGDMQNFDRAVEVLSQQSNILKGLKYKRLEAVCLCNLGIYQSFLYSKQKNAKQDYFQESIKNLLNSVTICKSINTKQIEYTCYGWLGIVYLRNKEYEISLEYIKKTPLGYLGVKGDIYTFAQLSGVYGCQKNFFRAIRNAKKAIFLSQKINNKEDEASAIAVIGNAHWHQGRHIQGLMYIVQSFCIVPPWKSVNSMLVLQIISTEIKDILDLKLNYLVNILRKIFNFHNST
jgi:tetratricopeptide (TPR) repeat protein